MGSTSDLIDFYHHEQNWANRFILGDSLLVMTSLAEKEGLKGKVQCLYFDPPYGINFGSNWQVSTRKRDVKDGKAEDATRQPEQIRAFCDTWQLGIHSYLAYLRDRLTVARELLTESGSVFVQIGDENVHLVRCVLDEVFGSENFVSHISFATSGGRASAQLPAIANYLLWYAKDKERVKFRRQFQTKERGGTGSGEFSWVDLLDGECRRMTREENDDPTLLPKGSRICIPSDLTSSHEYIRDPIDFRGKSFTPGKRFWSTSVEGMNRLGWAERLLVQGETLRFKRLLEDFPFSEFDNSWVDTAARGFFDSKIYVVQTGSRVIERCMLMTTDPGDLVLDPTCGSGTTAFVAEQWGRRWITIDTSRVAIALARTRLMAAKFPYYLLADSPEGVRKEAELTGKTPPGYKTENDIKKGFVSKRVPHVTL
jgi:adenine-specific DNA-methyltransferase